MKDLRKGFFLLLLISMNAFSQSENSIKDSLYIDEVENSFVKDKVLHAEPLFIDLIRDLGARKGEKEWNVGMGLTDNLKYDSYQALVEYEFAPADRIGVEIELPFTFYTHVAGISKDSVPSNKLSGIKTAVQWSFFVNERIATSMALGYINELELSDFRNFGNPFIKGNTYNPFLVIGKRWGNNFHSMVYTGPLINHHFKTGQVHVQYGINTSFHYMIPGTRNFVGIEFNKALYDQQFDMVIRPQMRLAISNQTMVGIVFGVPVEKTQERFSAFLRLIYEPKHKAH